MPTEPPPLASPQQYVKLVGPAPDGLDVDALIDAATSMVRAYCGWHIAPSIDETFVVDGPGTGMLLLPTLNLTAVTAAKADGADVDLDGVTWSRAGMVARRCGWPNGFGSVEVTATHGYDAVPAVITALVCTVVARAAASPTGVVREQVGSVSLTYSQVGFNVAGGTALLDHEQALLDQYKLPPRP